MPQPPKNSSDQNIFSAWQEGVSGASKNTSRKQQLLRLESELLPCFAEQYQALISLPRRMRRSLQRKWKQSLAGVALLLVLGQAPALAATINVGGSRTLARAITTANAATTAGETCTKGTTGADTINLAAGTKPTFSKPISYVYGPVALPVIGSAIKIAGNNSTISRASTAPKCRIFAVSDTGDLTLQRTTVTGGGAVDRTSYVGQLGGGIYNYRGTVTCAPDMSLTATKLTL
jgi:hypothetical protein